MLSFLAVFSPNLHVSHGSVCFLGGLVVLLHGGSIILFILWCTQLALWCQYDFLASFIELFMITAIILNFVFFFNF